jgi:hypothetical protein
MAGTAMTVWPDDQVSCPEPAPAPRTMHGDPLPRPRGLRTALHLLVSFGRLTVRHGAPVAWHRHATRRASPNPTWWHPPAAGRAPFCILRLDVAPAPRGRLRGSANRMIRRGRHDRCVGEPLAAPVPLATAPSVEPIRSHQVCAWKPGSGRPAQGAARGSPTAKGNALSPRNTPHPGRWPAQWRAGAGRNGEEAGGACEPIYRAAPRADCNLPLQWTIVPTPNTRY